MATQEQIDNYLGPAVADPVDVSLSHVYTPRTAFQTDIWDLPRINKARDSLNAIMQESAGGQVPTMLHRATALQEWWTSEGRFLPRHILNQLGIDPRYKTEREMDSEDRRRRSRNVLDFLGVEQPKGDPFTTQITGQQIDATTGATVKVSPEEQQKQERDAKLRGLSLEDLNYIKDTMKSDVLAFPPDLWQAVDKEIGIKKRLPKVLEIINERPLTILLGTDFFNSLAGGLPEFTSRKGVNPVEVLFGVEPGETSAILEAVSRVREMILAEDPRLTNRLALGMGDTLADLIKFTLLPDPAKLKAFAKLPAAVKAAIGVGSRAGMVELLKAPKEAEALEQRAKEIATATGVGAITGASLSVLLSAARAVFQQIKDLPISQQASRIMKEPGVAESGQTHAEIVRHLKYLKSNDPEQFAKSIGYKTPAKPVASVEVPARKLLPTGFRSGMAEIEGAGKFGGDVAKRAAKAAAKGEQQIAAAAAKVATVKPVPTTKVVSPEQAGPFGPGYEGKGEVPFRVIVDPKIRASVQAKENAVARLKTQLDIQKAKSELTLAKSTQAEILKREKEIETLRGRHEVQMTRTVEEAHAKLAKLRSATEFKAELVSDAVSMVKAIPRDLRADFVNRATNVKTLKGIQKLEREIDDRIEKWEKRAAIEDVTKTFKEIESASRVGSVRFGKIPSPQRERLIALRDSVDLAKLTEAKQAELESLEKHVQKMAIDLSGELSALDKSEPDDPTGFVPKRIIEGLQRLQRENINDWSTGDIQMLAVAAREIAHEAALKSELLIKQGLKPITVDNAVKQINESIVPTRRTAKEIASGKPVEFEGGKARHYWEAYKAGELHLDTLVELATGPDRDAIVRILDTELHNGQRMASEKLVDWINTSREQFRKLGFTDIKQLEETQEVTLAGQKMKLSADQLLKLERHFRSPDNLRAITKTQGWVINGKHVNYPRAMTPVERVRELNEALAAVRNNPMLSRLADFTDAMNYQTSTSVNEALQLLRGWGFVPDPHYTSRPRWRPRKVGGKGVDSVAAEDLGMFLPRTGGSSKIRLDTWSSDFSRQLETTAFMYGMGVPMRNARIVVENAAFQEAMINAGRREQLDAMLTILRGVQSTPTNASMVDMFGKKLLRMAGVAGLGFRVSSGITASLSYPIILADVDPRAMVRITGPVLPGYLEKMWKDSAILDLRWRGRRINAEVGMAASADSFSLLFLGTSSATADKSFIFVQVGDVEAIGNIHKTAVKNIAIRDRNGKNIDPYKWDGRDPADLPAMTTKFEDGYPTDPAYRFAAARHAEYLTRRTQPMYDMLDRSVIQSSPSIIAKSYSMFQTALNAQWNVAVRAVNDYSQTKDVGKFIKSMGALALGAVGVAIWKNYWKWAKDSAYREVKEKVGIFSFDEDRDLRTTQEELDTVLIESAKNLAKLTLFGRYAVMAGEIAGNRLTGEGYNWNRDLLENPALEIARDSVNMVLYKWTAAIKAAGLMDERVIEETPDDAAFNKKIEETFTSALWDAVKTTTSVGVRLAQVPLIAPYQEWIKPALRNTKIKIIREVTFADMDDPGPFAEKVARLYELRSRLKKKGDETRLSQAEDETLQTLDSFTTKLSKRADMLKEMSDVKQRRLEFRGISLEVDMRIQEIERLLQ